MPALVGDCNNKKDPLNSASRGSTQASKNFICICSMPLKEEVKSEATGQATPCRGMKDGRAGKPKNNPGIKTLLLTLGL